MVAGAIVTIVNPDIGFMRMRSKEANGSYRFNAIAAERTMLPFLATE